MNEKDIKFFTLLAKASQKELKIYLTHYLKDKYEKIIITNDYIIAKGDIPIGLVAHLDTVHKNLPVDIYQIKDENLLWSPQGLGADDRAGVFAIVSIIENGYRPHIIFTTDEERGGLGALQLVKKFKKPPFNSLHFLIELDRQGQNECVFYELDSCDFKTMIESYGFKTEEGSFSDISFIAPVWGCAAVNLSIGYEREHSLAETLNLLWLEETIKKVQTILEDSLEGRSQYYPYIEKKYSYFYKNNNKYKKNNYCLYCGKKTPKKKLIKNKYCADCYDKLTKYDYFY